MHNLHLIIINAESAKDAVKEVESHISDWGNENNWRSVGGVASESGNDDIENHENGRWGLDFLDEIEGLSKEGSCFERTKQYILSLVSEPITIPYVDTYPTVKEAFENLGEKIKNFDPEHGQTSDLWAWTNGMDFLHNVVGAQRALSKDPNTIPELYSWEFDKCGVTDISDGASELGRYIVFLDMHS